MYVNLFTQSNLFILRVLGILLRYIVSISYARMIQSRGVSSRASQSRRLLAKVYATDWQTGDLCTVTGSRDDYRVHIILRKPGDFARDVRLS